MFRLTVLCFFLAVLSTAFATEKSIHIDEKYRSFMNSYCLDCHNAKRKKGKVRFDKEGFSFEIKTIQDADLWQKVLTAINAKEMPPEDEDQPKDAEKVEFLEMLSGKMVEARDFFKDTGGKTLMRRLNRREYANTLKQLIGVDVDVSSLPEDHSPYGFDTNGGSLFMSSDQIEQYMKIARTGLKKALTAPVKIQKVRLEPELTATPELQERANKYVSKYEGGLAFDKSKDKNKDPKDYGLVDARDAFTSKNEYKKFYGAVKYYLDHPLTKTGFLLGLNRHNQNQTFTMPRPGIYKIRARVGKTKNAPDDRSFLDLGFFDGSQKAFYREDSFHVTKSVQEGQIIESVIEVKDKKVLSFRERQRPRSAAKIYRAYNHKHGRGLDGALWIDWVEWEGPFPQNKSTLIKSVVGTLSKESTNSQVRDLIEGFTKSTFRNSEVSRDYLNGLLGVYKTELKLSGDPQKAIIEPLAMVLSSPSFIYLSEPVKENSSKKVDQRELAVRLAFFLWSTAPDSELLDLAARSKLAKDDVLFKQIERMLRDPKSDNFYKDFTHQWLDMDRLDFFEFDEEKFPTFGKTMKYFAAEEVYQTVKTIVMENLGSENLLKSDFVVVNGMLAVHYGIEGVEGDAFRKVTLGEQSIRGGLTGMAAIMAMGSDGKKSSPVERGAWVLRKILNQPPPPAPANVPQLGRLEGQNLTAREILLAHQAEPQCAHCHKKIDPLGFGLENFGPTGEWRTEITLNEKSKTKKVKETKTYKVDASGSLFNGPKFRNYSELRDIFVSRQDDFNRGLISNMLSYALGRPSGFSDQELIDELHTEMKDKNNSIKALIYAIVKSAPFRMKR